MSSRFNNVLIATDLSPASLAVVNCLEGLHPLGTRKCVLLHCLNIHERPTLSDQSRRFYENTLAEQEQALEAMGIATTVRVRTGLPEAEVPRAALNERCSIIVVGSHGQNLASEILLGGVASAVIHHATVPVLIIRLTTDVSGRATCAMGHCDLLQHVLYTTDFSDKAERALDYVAHLVASGARKVTLLHVQDKTRLSPHLEHRLDEFNRIDRERLSQLKERLAPLGKADIQIELPFGAPKREIVNFARQQQCSLIVMSTQGRGFIEEIALGSVSHTVARHAICPVLLVPAQRPLEGQTGDNTA